MQVYIEDFYRDTDGNDWLPAFYRAQTMFATSTPSATYGGFSLYFRARSYYFSNTLNVLRPLSLIGSGGVANPGTTLMFPKGRKGIIFHGQATNIHAEYGGDPSLGDSFAQGSILEKLMLLAVDPIDRMTPASTHAMLDFRESCIFPNQGAHGVVLYTQAVLRDVTIANFDGHGIYIFGNGDDDAKRPDIASHTAFWQLQNLFVYGNGGDGLHTYGQDCSGGVVTACQFLGNAGWGVCDLNYLGQSTYISGQTANNITGGVARPYNVINRNYGHYAELLSLVKASSPEAAILIAALPAILAATPEPDASSFPDIQDSMQINASNPLYRQSYRDYRDAWDNYASIVGDRLQEVLNPTYFEPDVHLDFGNPYAAGGNIFLNYYAEDNGIGDGTHNVIGGTNFCVNSNFISTNTDTLGWTAQGFRNTFLGESGIDCKILESDALVLRSGSDTRTITYSDTQPIDDRPVGTLIFNSNPVAGGFVGWVSLGKGNWRNFGAID
jgi:hypothetical protein